MKKIISSLTVIFCLYSTQTLAGDFDELGAPTSVHCTAEAYDAVKPISAGQDINYLLTPGNFKTVTLGDVDPSCAKYEGDKSGTCAVVIEADQLYMRYAFNSQNGNISIDDKATGFSVYNPWYNQYNVTKSGYLTVSTTIQNVHGGIGGVANRFEVDFECQAYGNDWPPQNKK